MNTNSENEINEFFAALGEIWRDITAIEFLMRIALAQKDGEIDNFPQPPYSKGRVYLKYPSSFAHKYFSNVIKEFNNKFPNLAMPKELEDLRNAMAHGIIAQINKSGPDQLVKFRNQENGELLVEFAKQLEMSWLQAVRLNLAKLRRKISLLVSTTDYLKDKTPL
jgi:hypothetical protein